MATRTLGKRSSRSGRGAPLLGGIQRDRTARDSGRERGAGGGLQKVTPRGLPGVSFHLLPEAWFLFCPGRISPAGPHSTACADHTPGRRAPRTQFDAYCGYLR